MVTQINAQAVDCSLYNALAPYIQNLVYGIDCGDGKAEELQEQAEQAFKQQKLKEYSAICGITSEQLCLFSGLDFSVDDCGVIVTPDPCYADIGLTYTCSNNFITISPVDTTLNIIPTSDMITVDGALYSGPIEIGNNCVAIQTATATFLSTITMVTNPNTFSHTFTQTQITALENLYDSYSPLDIVTITVNSPSGSMTFREYKYKMLFVVTGSNMIVQYDTVDNTHPYSWCSDIKTDLDNSHSFYEAVWPAYVVGSAFNSIVMFSEEVEFPTGTVPATRLTVLPECGDPLETTINILYNQGLCGSTTLCDEAHDVEVIDVQIPQGLIIDLSSYFTHEIGTISVSTLSQPATLLGTSFDTTGLSGLFIFENTHGPCFAVDYLYVYIQDTFDVSVTSSSLDVCTNNGVLDLYFVFSSGTAPYTVEYVANGVTSTVILNGDGTIPVTVTQSGPVTISSITDSAPSIATITGNTVYNAVYTPSGSTLLSSTGNTYNSTTGNIDWTLSYTNTAGATPLDILNVEVVDENGNVVAEADFLLGVSTLQNPATDVSNWTSISQYITDNSIGLLDTIFEFDKFEYALAQNKVGIGLGEDVTFNYTLTPSDGCIIPSQYTETVQEYKSPLILRLSGGTFPGNNSTCASASVNYQNAYYDVAVQGVGGQSITPTISNWSVTNDYMYQGDECHATLLSGFTEYNPVNFSSKTWDINTIFTYPLQGTTPNVGLGPVVSATGVNFFRGVYTSVPFAQDHSSSNIVNTQYPAYYANQAFRLHGITIGTPAMPVQAQFTGALSSLPTLEAYTNYYLMTTDQVFIPRYQSVTAINSNTFEFEFQLATGRARNAQHPLALSSPITIAGTTYTQTSDNPISYNYARIIIEDTPGGSPITYNMANAPVQYTDENVIVGGVLNNGGSINGIEETITKSFATDGVYNIIFEVSVNAGDGNTYASTNKSQLLVVSF